MGKVVQFNYRSRVTKSWNSLESYRQFLAQEDKSNLIERYEACSGKFKEPTLIDYQMRICVVSALIEIGMNTPELLVQLSDDVAAIAKFAIEDLLVHGSSE